MCNKSDTSLIQDNVKGPLGARPFPFHHFVSIGTIRAYQLFISPSKGSFCPMHPHCSLYGYQAFKQYNPIKAFLMTTDRLHRCGHDLDNYKTVEVNEMVRWADPVPISPTCSSNPNEELHSVSLINDQGFLLSPRNSKMLSGNSSDSANEANLLFRFAEALDMEGDYDRAITEYRRLLFYFPDSDYRDSSLNNIFFCYYKSQNFLSAIHWGQNNLMNGINSSGNKEIKLFIGASYFRLGNFSLAQNYFKDLMYSDYGNFREESLLLQGLALANEARWAESRQCFANFGSDSKFYREAQECEKLAQKGEELNLRSPTTAGILAIIPGLGYFYDGYEQTAFSAFIVNGLFIWATTQAFRKNNESLGVMLGVLSFGWYVGNIYGSVLSAQRKNIKLKNDLLIKFNIGFKF